MSKCATCGHVSKKGEPQHRKKLCQELCEIMGWPVENVHRLYAQVLNTEKLSELIKMINQNPKGEI